jgi:hypothetical protein
MLIIYCERETQSNPEQNIRIHTWFHRFCFLVFGMFYRISSKVRVRGASGEFRGGRIEGNGF